MTVDDLFARLTTRTARSVVAVLACTAVLAGCPTGANSPDDVRPPRAQKWYDRAQAEYRIAQLDAAYDSARHALDLVPGDEQVRLLAAQVALARLEYDEVLRLLRGIVSSSASALRGRAYWYQGELDRAADELDKLLADPEVTDKWAKSITKLARRGAGRKPFEITTTEGRLAVVQMARVAPGIPLYIVPLEIDGDKALALVSTGTAEVMIDGATRREPSWVSLRFGGRLEVKDVPALTQDLSGISHQLGAPIKALLGANLLRHLNVTLDHRGRQFVVRSFVPPPPPVASRVDVHYLRGGGMVLGSAFGPDPGQPTALFVDSGMAHSVALDEGGWKKLGIEAGKLPLAHGSGDMKLRVGSIPLLRLGAFKLPQIPAVFGPPIDRVEQELNIDVDGVVGAGLLSKFRLTLSDHGRVLWVEQPADIVLPPAGPLPPGPLPIGPQRLGLPPAMGPGGLPGGDPIPVLPPISDNPLSPIPPPPELPESGGKKNF
jgi:tetratricopeptide (TPR) repeat protein